jgi:hypothetical protein
MTMCLTSSEQPSGLREDSTYHKQRKYIYQVILEAPVLGKAPHPRMVFEQPYSISHLVKCPFGTVKAQWAV